MKLIKQLSLFFIIVATTNGFAGSLKSYSLIIDDGGILGFAPDAHIYKDNGKFLEETMRASSEYTSITSRASLFNRTLSENRINTAANLISFMALKNSAIYNSLMLNLFSLNDEIDTMTIGFFWPYNGKKISTEMINERHSTLEKYSLTWAQGIVEHITSHESQQLSQEDINQLTDELNKRLQRLLKCALNDLEHYIPKTI